MLNETESDYRRYPHPQEGSNIDVAMRQGAAMLMSQSITSTQQQVSCDQVAWLGDILDRHCHAVTQTNPAISRAKESARLAALLEIMEVLRLEFADDTARRNAIAGFKELRMVK